MRILIVEDEPLIAMLLADWIIELGKEPIGPAATVGSALLALNTQPIEAAIVDLNLRHERCDPIIRELNERQIPWVLASGEGKPVSDLMQDCVGYLRKPYDFSSVQEIVSALLEHGSAV